MKLRKKQLERYHKLLTRANNIADILLNKCVEKDVVELVRQIVRIYDWTHELEEHICEVA